MASEMSSNKDADGCNTKQGTHATVKSTYDTKGKSASHLGKAVAHRAVFKSNRHRIEGRKPANNDAKSLPSRLSKVSLAET